MLGSFGYHHAIDHDAGHLDLAGVERVAVGDALDLGDDDAAGVARGHGDGETSNVSASRSMVILPLRSAVVPRMMPTSIGKAL